MDDVDLKLLAILSEGSKQKYTDLAEVLNMSAPSIHSRVKKLESTGVIKRYGVELDSHLLGLKVCAFVRITLENAGCRDVAAHFHNMPEIEESHSVAGEECLLIKVRTMDPTSLAGLLDRIRRIPGVRKTVTSVVLETLMDRPTDPRSLIAAQVSERN